MPTITLAMRTYTHHSEVWLPHPPDRVFPFFADAFNLNALTPDYLQFHILTPRPISMAPGTLIDYRLKVRGIPLRWRTLIEVWEPPYRFVDRQLKGPYKLWRHEHRFHPADGGTLCVDHVQYAVPGGPLAPLLHRLLVRGDVQAIFAYRSRRLAELFRGESLPVQAGP